MDQNRVVCMGDFALLRQWISRKKTTAFWVGIGMIDSVLRGISQAILVNNTISGLLILIALASTSPGVLVSGFISGFLGLLISMLVRESINNIENGLTVYNPVLIGCITYSFLINTRKSLDSFVILLIFVATILSVYLTKALTKKNFPCVTIPFNISEIILLSVLLNHKNSIEYNESANTQDAEINTTMEIRNEGPDVLLQNKTDLIWGLVFRGIITSSSQVFAVDDVAAGSVIYLAILIFSPITAVFSLLGAVIGCFVSIGLNVPYHEIYSGKWGYNSLLSSAAFGGLFIVLNHQTVPLAFVVSIFTVLLQYVLQPLFLNIYIPILTVPFILTFCLFVGICESSLYFPKPKTISFPEEHRLIFLSQGVHDLHVIGTRLEE